MTFVLCSQITRVLGRCFFAALAGGALTSLHPSAGAQPAASPQASYPNGPVRLVIPYSPGGINDTAGRLIATQLSERWKQPVVVENRGGASGSIGAGIVMRAPPDGYALLIGNSSMLLTSLTEPSLNLNLVNDFTALSLIGTSALALTVSNEMGVRSMGEFVSVLKAAPAKYSYGTQGSGSSAHLYSQRLSSSLGVAPVPVHYPGSAPLLGDLLTGRIDFAFVDQMAIRQHVLAGKLKVIALTGTRRTSVFPDVPTFSEAGVAGFEMTSWLGLYGPLGTPAAVVRKIADDLTEVLGRPDVLERFAQFGTDARGSSPEEFARIVAAHQKDWASMVSEANLQRK